MTVQDLINELQSVPNPEVTAVALTTSVARTAYETVSAVHTGEISGGIDLADGGVFVLQDV